MFAALSKVLRFLQMRLNRLAISTNLTMIWNFDRMAVQKSVQNIFLYLFCTTVFRSTVELHLSALSDLIPVFSFETVQTILIV